MLADAVEVETKQNISSWARGGAVGLVGSFFGVALGLVWQFFLARILGPAGLGNFSLGFSVITVLSVLVPLGLDSGAMRYVSFHYSKKDMAGTAGVIKFTTRISILLSLLITPLLVWQSNWIAVEIFKKPDFTRVLQILLLGLPLFVVFQVLGSILQGFQRIGTQLFAQQILVPIFRLTGLLFVFYFIGSVNANNVSIVIVIACALGVLTLSVAVYRQYPVHEANKIRTAFPVTDLMRYSSQSLLMSAVEQIGNGSQVFLLGFFVSSSEIGIYAVAAKAAMVLGLFLISLNLIAAPAISALYARGNEIGMHSLYKVITRWAFTLALPFFLIIMILAPDIMAVFGSEFKAGAPVLQLIAIGQIINVATGPCGWMLNMTDHQHLNVLNNFLALLVAVALSLMLIPTYGAVGAALAVGSSTVLINLLRLLQVYRVLHFHPYNISFIKPIFAGLLAMLAVLWIDYVVSYNSGWLHLIISTMVLLVTYWIFFFVLKPEPEDKTALQNIMHIGA